MKAPGYSSPDAGLIVGWLTRAVLGQPMPSHTDPAFNQVLEAILRVSERADWRVRAVEAADISLAALVVLAEALRRSGQAEKQAANVSQLN